ncbi:hypothetical protein SAMN05421676_101481 [Salinibacillus kushneri]|uniref:Uncharacterized protein n=1 Tax=Salinibacillus kushneri TaxID=237682 RepID=A0A1H9ZE85_9BACI|nr:hypothetical protein [Salinibacillus kushneri]SES79893.1 hypothetical protein SAMN05421676_101481 [Salinibacillus kushneri]
MSYRIFQVNQIELSKLLDEYASNSDLALSLSSNREKLDDLFREITRLLHNFLAAAKTLVDHTRVFYNEEYKGTEFEKDYNSKIKGNFIDIPISKFVQDLRNYILHKTLPIAGATLSFNMGAGISHSITLDAKSLKEWDKWTSKSKEYLESIPEDRIILKDVVDGYANQVTEFYSWFGDKQKEIHSKDIEELHKLQAKQKELYKKAGWDDMLI